MVTQSAITLFREKTVVNDVSSEKSMEDDIPVIMLRSNRVVFNYRPAAGDPLRVIVRGQNIPATLRMVYVVMNYLENNGERLSLHYLISFPWEKSWARVFSEYEKEFRPYSWVSLHVNGQHVFSTRQSVTIDALERLAMGGDITDALIEDTSRFLFGDNRDYVIYHESQTASVFSRMQGFYRATVLERLKGKTASFVISIHDKPTEEARFSLLFEFCSYVQELLYLKSMLNKAVDFQKRFGDKIDQDENLNRIYQQMNRELEIAYRRRRQLTQLIVDFERNRRIVYLPERPKY